MIEIVILVAVAFAAYQFGLSQGRKASNADKPVVVKKPRTRKQVKAEVAPVQQEIDWAAINSAINDAITQTAKAAFVAAKRGWMVKPLDEGGVSISTKLETETFLLAYINAEEGTVVNPAGESLWSKAMQPAAQPKALPQNTAPVYSYDDEPPPPEYN